MKLKEKLAEDWWVRNRDLNNKGEGTFSHKEAYLAGFEKAQEMMSLALEGPIELKTAIPDGPTWDVGSLLQMPDVLQMPDGCILITQKDYAKLEGKFRFFATKEDANTFLHDVSLKQLPDWHKDYCPVCTGKKVNK